MYSVSAMQLIVVSPDSSTSLTSRASSKFVMFQGQGLILHDFLSSLVLSTEKKSWNNPLSRRHLV